MKLIGFLILLAVGYIVGTWNERRHYRSIEARERDSLHIPAVTLRKNTSLYAGEILRVRMVYGNAVISVDYFKRIVAGLRMIFGGTVKSYESLIDRARREATLRMKEMAPDATIIINVRIETSRIGQSAHKKGLGSVEALAYGTAIFMRE